jgi:N6-L-threonylcarbamoyladenine synthase
MVAAKTMSVVLNKPFMSINHLEGHILSACLENEISYPFLALIASGGHCQFVIAENLGKYHQIGKTLDDSVGEAFDKVAKMLGLGYPGGPEIEKRAKYGDPHAFQLPMSMCDNKNNCDMSFSGIKTAVLRIVQKIELSEAVINDICASFQHIISKILTYKMENAIAIYHNMGFKNKNIVITGGVSANLEIISKMQDIASKYDFTCFSPSKKFCTDNAAMIAYVALERYRLNLFKHEDIYAEPRSKWPIASLYSDDIC